MNLNMKRNMTQYQIYEVTNHQGKGTLFRNIQIQVDEIILP